MFVCHPSTLRLVGARWPGMAQAMARPCIWLLCWLCWLAAPVWAQSSQAAPASQATPVLRVQLLWYHQAQFAGLYMAQARKYFEAEGLQVILVEGGEGINPITELQSGRVDLALSCLSNAWARSTPEAPVTHVAQALTGDFMSVVCRTDAGVRTPRELAGQRIGVWRLGDELMVQELLRRQSIPPERVQLVTQKPRAQDLISGDLPCVTAMTYNEYWHILAAGLSPDELVVFSPKDHGVTRMEDGVYALHERLAAPEFRDLLVRFTRAMRRGWMEARQEPTLALQVVQLRAPTSHRDHQRHMLETLLAELPAERDFGFLDLKRYESAAETLRTQLAKTADPPLIWTHQIWNALHPPGVITPATRHHVRGVFDSAWFGVLVLLGTLAFAFSATLEAIDRGYGLWGRLLVAMVASMGGGAIRDLLVGGDRLPYYFMSDMRYPVGIFLIVIAASLLVKPTALPGQSGPLVRTRLVCETLGFALIAVNGAFVALIAQLSWYWVPFCAALSCTGGGLLQDVLMNREPSAFRSRLFEEIAIVTALSLLLVLLLANQLEQSNMPVYASVAVGLVVAIG